MPPKRRKVRNEPSRDPTPTFKEEDSSNEHDFNASDKFPTPSLTSPSLRMSYAIARGEQGVLTFEPYKSLLLPHWRFRTVSIAQASSSTLYSAFTHYLSAGDFVGADMARKFIQMGMTRAKRYANHKGGRKYDRTAREAENEGGERKELPKSTGHQGMEEKLAASEVFKEVWRRCIADKDYLRLKGEWQKEKREWEQSRSGGVKDEDKDGDIDVETEMEIKNEDND